MGTPGLRAHELFQIRNAFDGSSAPTLFRSSVEKIDPVSRRVLGLKVAGGVRIDVALRCRPVSEAEEAAGEPVVLKVDPAKRSAVLRTSTSLKTKGDTFRFDHVFDAAASQADIYRAVAAPVVDEALKGMNCCILAYGQTGTGKTYTMLGDMTAGGLDDGHAGLIPRAVQAIFARKSLVDEETRLEYAQSSIVVSFLEIYNEQMEDLFTPTSHRLDDDGMSPFTAGSGTPVMVGSPRSRGELKLVDDKLRGTVCQNLTEVMVREPSEVMRLLEEANTRCHIAATRLNKQSNRAHRIFTITTTYKECTNIANEKIGKLTLVDLAGSECIGRSGVDDLMAKEAGTINKSLLTLGRVIQALVHNERHVPYRDSKLTRLLAEALGGVCKTSIIATVSPAARSSDETLSTLRYAQSAMDAVNIEQMPKSRRLELQVKQLAAAYEQLAADSEKHIGALQRNLAVAVDERKQAMRQLDQCQLQLSQALQEKRQVETDNVHLKLRVQQLEEDVRGLREQHRLTQLDLREVIVDRDLLRQTKDANDREHDWLKSKHTTLLSNQKSAMEGIRTNQTASLEDAVDATNFAKLRLEEDFGKLDTELTKVQDTVASWGEDTVDEHLEVHARNTAFVAEVTQLLNRLDKYVKETVATYVQGVEESRQLMAEHLRREISGAQAQEEELLGRVAEMVRAHSSKNNQRLESLAAAANIGTSRSAHAIQEFGSRTSEQLTTIGQRGSRFYQNSELFSADAKSKVTERTQKVLTAITTIEAKSETVHRNAAEQMSSIKDTFARKANEVAAAASSSLAMIGEVETFEFIKPQPQRRTLQSIAQSRPDDLPPSLSGAMTRAESARSSPGPQSRPSSIADLMKDRNGDVVAPSEMANPRSAVEAMIRSASPRTGMTGTNVVPFAEMREDTNPVGHRGDNATPGLDWDEKEIDGDEEYEAEYDLEQVRLRSSSADDLDRIIHSPPKVFNPKQATPLIEALLDAHSPFRQRGGGTGSPKAASRRYVQGIGGHAIDSHAMQVARVLQSSSPLRQSPTRQQTHSVPLPPSTPAITPYTPFSPSPATVMSSVSGNKPKSFAVAPQGSGKTKASPRSASATKGRASTPISSAGGFMRNASRMRSRPGDQ